MALAFLGGAGLFGLSLFRTRRRSKWGSAFFGLTVAVVLAAFAIAGCGSSGAKTPAGTYQVSVTGTAGSGIHTANYSLTVSK